MCTLYSGIVVNACQWDATPKELTDNGQPGGDKVIVKVHFRYLEALY